VVTIPSRDSFIDAAFVSLRDNKPLHITMADQTVAIRTDDMELAGDVVQDLCEVLKITELDTVAIFPAEMEHFRKAVANVGEYNQARVKLTTDMADSSNLIKTLLIKAEDCRLLGDMRTMRQVYATLYEINRELIGEYKKRENNQAALMGSLKEMNQTIQRAARLRVGQAKTAIISKSREAVVANNIEALFKLLRVSSS
jgi:Bardet-Biedl syndrome 2 protein